MPRRMYDSVNAASVPTDGDLYAAYIDGLYANLNAFRRRFPHARIVTITVLGTPGADVADCETGDLTPDHAARWAAEEVHSGRKPTIYCNTSTWPAVKERVAAYKVSGRVAYWVAQYDGKPVLPAGAVAKQYLGDHPNGHGGTYDASIVLDHWPGVDPDPIPTPPTPKPQPKKADVKLILKPGTRAVYSVPGGFRSWIPSEAVLNAMGYTLADVHQEPATSPLWHLPVLGPDAPAADR